MRSRSRISEIPNAFPGAGWDTEVEYRPLGCSFRSFLLTGNIFQGADFWSSLMEAPRARVIVVDDSELFRRAAASVISATSTLRLVGIAASGEEAIELVPAVEPDLVLLDFHMPGMDGIQTTRIIRRHKPRTVVIVISAEPDRLGDAAREAGAATTLHKRDFLPSKLDALWLKHTPDGG